MLTQRGDNQTTKMILRGGNFTQSRVRFIDLIRFFKYGYKSIVFTVLFFGVSLGLLTPSYCQVGFPGKCIDLGVGVDGKNDEYFYIDFFKNNGNWEAKRYTNNQLAHDSLRNWYRVYSLNEFKVVNGKYWHWDSNWDGVFNNKLWGDNWADCYMTYFDMMVDQKKITPSGYPTSIPCTIYQYKNKTIDPT